MKNNYKLNKYVVFLKRENYAVVFNTLNGTMLYFNNVEHICILKKIFDNNYIDSDIGIESELIQKLISSQVLIEKNIDETEIALGMFMNRFKNNTSLRLMIYVTDDCNFNCVYCPQVHQPIYMTMSTMKSLINAVDNLLSTKPYDSLVISWFGGEPLLNLPIIRMGMDGFISLANKYNINIHGGMTTNGYLLTKEIFLELLSLEISEFQITLDGNEDTHNKNRLLKGGLPSWTKIWNNLIVMKEVSSEFLINIRINVNLDNVYAIPDFVKMVKNTFDNRFVTSIQPIVNMGGQSPQTYTKYCSLLESQLIQLELYNCMSKNGNEDIFLENIIQPFGMMCNCSDPNYYVIRQDGEICKCELLVYEGINEFGNVNDETLEIKDKKFLNATIPSVNHECLNCKMYPMCFGLTCPYRRINKNDCITKDTFLLEEYIDTISLKYIERLKNDL